MVTIVKIQGEKSWPCFQKQNKTKPKNFQVRLTYVKHKHNQRLAVHGQTLTLATVQSGLYRQPEQKVVLRKNV